MRMDEIALTKAAPELLVPAPAEVGTTKSAEEPAEGAILAPGDHLVELATPAPCRPDELAAGLARLGFMKAAIDVTPRVPTLRGTLRFVGRLSTPLAVRSVPLVRGQAPIGALRWVYVRRLAFDVFAKPRAFEEKNHVEPFELHTGLLYETRFFAPAMRGKKNRERYAREPDPVRALTLDQLAEMRFEVVKLAAMARDTRLPSKPDTQVVLWCALLRWNGPDALTLEDHPFFFDDLVTVAR